MSEPRQEIFGIFSLDGREHGSGSQNIPQGTQLDEKQPLPHRVIGGAIYTDPSRKTRFVPVEQSAIKVVATQI